MELTEEEQLTILALYAELYQPLTVYARSALGRPEAAEEAVQETFRIACAKPAALLTSPDQRSWLLVTLKYVIQNLRRSRAELTRLLYADYGYALDPAAQASGGTANAREFLGERDFDLLARFANEGRTLKEAADEAGVSVAECQFRFRLARRRLLSRTDPEKYLGR